MPKRADPNKARYKLNNRQPTASLTSLPLTPDGPAAIRVHSGLLRSKEELDAFINLLRDLAAQRPTDYVRAYQSNPKR